MSEDNKTPPTPPKPPLVVVPDNIVDMDDLRVKRLTNRGHYISLLEQFDLLRVKFMYDQLSKQEALRFVTLCKYFMEHGHSESLKLTCKYIYKRYMESYGL